MLLYFLLVSLVISPPGETILPPPHIHCVLISRLVEWGEKVFTWLRSSLIDLEKHTFKFQCDAPVVLSLSRVHFSATVYVFLSLYPPPLVEKRKIDAMTKVTNRNVTRANVLLLLTGPLLYSGFSRSTLNSQLRESK